MWRFDLMGILGAALHTWVELHLAARLVRVEHLFVEVDLVLERVVLVLGCEVDSLSHVLRSEVQSCRLGRRAPPGLALVLVQAMDAHLWDASLLR